MPEQRTISRAFAREVGCPDHSHWVGIDHDYFWKWFTIEPVMYGTKARGQWLWQSAAHSKYGVIAGSTSLNTPLSGPWHEQLYRIIED